MRIVRPEVSEQKSLLGFLTGGIGAEIASWISENCFQMLDAPVNRVGSLDTPVPFAGALEADFLPVSRFEEKLIALNGY